MGEGCVDVEGGGGIRFRLRDGYVGGWEQQHDESPLETAVGFEAGREWEAIS